MGMLEKKTEEFATGVSAGSDDGCFDALHEKCHDMKFFACQFPNLLFFFAPVVETTGCSAAW
jgi:hypothetical protein